MCFEFSTTFGRIESQHCQVIDGRRWLEREESENEWRNHRTMLRDGHNLRSKSMNALVGSYIIILGVAVHRWYAKGALQK